MNTYLLQLIGKWIGLIIISITSLFTSYNIQNAEIINKNDHTNKSLSIKHIVVDYETIIKNNSKLPWNEKRTLVKGKNGLVYIDDHTKKQEVIHEVIHEVIEVGTGRVGRYNGRLTAYGADCKGCSGTVACLTQNRKAHNLIKNGTTYTDKEYGEVRILAATHDVFPCGTIVEVTRNNTDPFIGVVLDTGIAMRRAWKNDNKIIMDLAFETESDPEVFKTTSNNVKYNVLRWGW